MDALLNAGLANALTVLILAPIVAIIARLLKRPAVSHALWLILLIKLITPPWVSVPIVPEMKAAVIRPVVVPQVIKVDEPKVDRIKTEVSEIIAVDDRASRSIALPSWRILVAATWLIGSAAWLILAVWRVVRFARSLRFAEPASDALQSQIDDWATRIGLRRSPEVLLVASRISPMIWSLGGRSRLILPESFWKRLDREQQASLVFHELAHLRRLDHWIRPLEMLATGLFWWHPALWWVRRGLREAEEQCCDLWVVWAMPAATKPYASTLVEAVDFLCEGCLPLPAGASGMGQVHDLSRRISMIMRGTTPRAMSRSGWLAMLGLMALLLPLRPSWSHEPKAEAPPQVPIADPLANPNPEPNPLPEANAGDFAAKLKLTRAALREFRSYEIEAP